jgi:hypothetical protein
MCIASGIMVSVLASRAANLWFDPLSGQTKDYKIGICCFSAKYTALTSKIGGLVITTMSIYYCLSCNTKLSANSWNKRRSNRFQWWHLWRQHLYWYRFFLSLYMQCSCILQTRGGRRGRDRMGLDLQLPMQSVPITTNVVSSNIAHGEVYSIQHYVIKFVSDLRQVKNQKLLKNL